MKKTFSITHLFIISAVVLLMVPVLLTAQEPDWLVRLKHQKWMSKVADLKLLKTNRAEAEKILGKPEEFDFKTNHYSEYYTIGTGRIFLGYTTKECTSTDGKISKDTIEKISFSPKSDILFSKLKLPLKQFKHSRESDNPTEHYENEKTGIDVSVQYGKVDSIDFEIPEQKNYSCVTVSSFLKDLDKVKNLKLLESNREDVRKIFAGYEKSDSFENSEYKDKYFAGDARIEIFYSQGSCQFDDSDEYDSAEWNVERINVSPNNSIFPQEFGINLVKYRKEQVYKNVSDVYIYYDKDLGISFWVSEGKINEINFYPSQKYNSLMCDKERAKILSATESIFTEKLRDRIYDENGNASVKNVYLSKREIITDNSFSNQEKSQSDNQKITVFTRVNNPNGDVLTYSYTVSEGKIIGRGEKVIWDLSGVKAGTYKITVAVDDGCGFCGQPASNTVIVK
ncbi:MAG: hypothetical protein ACR2GD_12895 [Pyrinomonadaceae bacterium]